MSDELDIPDGLAAEQILPPGAAQRYRDLRRVGYGGMGEVFRAFDTHVERDVAVKVIRQDCAASTSLRARFRREVVVLSKVDHPAVVRFYDFSDEGACTFYTMEFVEGRKLDTIIAEGTMPVDEAVDLMRRLCDGVAAVHAQGIVHRDIKPDNVLVTADGQPKLIDFGIAKFVDPMSPHQYTASNEMVGTFRYLPPEVLGGNEADERSDVYQLTVILYELLTGRHPFGDKTVVDIVQGNAFDTIPRPSTLRDGVDGELDRIVRAGLELSPARRLPGAAALRDVLQAWAVGDDTGIARYERPVPERVQPTFWQRLTPKLLCLAIVAFFLSRLALSVAESTQYEDRILGNLLHTAAQRGDAEEIKRLAKIGCRFDGTDERGDTPLHHAARRGHQSAVAALLELGAPADARNGAGKTARDLAAEGGHGSIVATIDGLAAQGTR